MKIVCRIITIFVWGPVCVLFMASCANQGMPTGGPQDSIPPVLVETFPEYQALNFDKEEVRLTFNEFIIPDQVSEMLVVSPPLKKRPTVLTKSKSLLVRFNEDLRDSVTYSLDFKNSVVDNNERNPYENLRFLFSTGNQIDTLRIAGRVMNAFNLEPVENTLVLLHKNLHDSAVYSLIPDYIARTDAEGLYLFDNLAPGSYHLYSVNDMNSDMLYNEGAEEIAFHDTLLVPSAEYHADPDTLARGADSLLVEGHTHFSPPPVYLRQFTEHIFDQYLEDASRSTPFICTFVFNETVRDSFHIRVVNGEPADSAGAEPAFDPEVINQTDWYVLEPNQKYDSLTMWIADTALAARESIQMELSYFMVDSLSQLYLKKDTVEMEFQKKEEETRRKRRDRNEEEEEEEPEVVQFSWITNLRSSGFDLNRDIVITSPQPVKELDSSAVRLYLTDDTLQTALPFSFMQDTLAWRTYRVAYPWESETSYTLEIDSAACVNIYGVTSKKLQSAFQTQSADHYGTINLAMSAVPGQVLVQLLDNTEEETVLQEKVITEDQQVVFEYLEPKKFKVKVIFDANANGKWDPGSFQDKYQPERVAYINEVIKVKSNWDNNISWDLEFDPAFTKNIRDRELEEQKRKEAEEKARQEQNGRLSPSQQQNDFNQGSLPGGMQPF